MQNEQFEISFEFLPILWKIRQISNVCSQSLIHQLRNSKNNILGNYPTRLSWTRAHTVCKSTILWQEETAENIPSKTVLCMVWSPNNFGSKKTQLVAFQVSEIQEYLLNTERYTEEELHRMSRKLDVSSRHTVSEGSQEVPMSVSAVSLA